MLLTRCLVTLVCRHTTVAISRIHQQRVGVLPVNQRGDQSDLSAGGIHAEDVALLTVRVEEILNLKTKDPFTPFKL